VRLFYGRRMKRIVLISAVICLVAPTALPAAAAAPRVAMARVFQRYSGDQGFAVGFGSVWVGGTNNGETITRLALTGDTTKDIAAPSTDYVGLAAGPTAIWVSDFGANLVRRIDPATNRVTLIHGLPGPSGYAFEGSKVYVALHHGQAVAQLDATNGRIVRRFPVPSPGGGVTASGPSNLAVAYGAVWASVPNLQAVVRISPTGATKVLRLGEGCGGSVAAAGGGLWVACDRQLVRLNPATRRVTVRLPLTGDLAVLNGRLWVAAAGGRLVDLDPRTGAVASTSRFPGAFWDDPFIAAGGHLWAWDANRARIDEFAVGS
jgi:outer membrane protein assembly factor BamB